MIFITLKADTFSMKIYIVVPDVVNNVHTYSCKSVNTRVVITLYYMMLSTRKQGRHMINQIYYIKVRYTLRGQVFLIYFGLTDFCVQSRMRLTDQLSSIFSKFHLEITLSSSETVNFVTLCLIKKHTFSKLMPIIMTETHLKSHNCNRY